jgi:ankyrin repeat protein
MRPSENPRYKGPIGLIRLGYDLLFDYGHNIEYYISKNLIKDVEYLLKHGADANQIIDDIPIIHCSTSSEMLRLLVKYGSDINKTISNTNNDIFYMSCINNNIEMMHTCIKLGANPNTLYPDIGTALIRASTHGLIEIAQMLIKNGADVNKSFYYNSGYITPLIMAITFCQKHIIKILIDNGVIITSNEILLSIENDIYDEEIATVLQKEFLKRIEFLPLPLDVKRMLLIY